MKNDLCPICNGSGCPTCVGTGNEWPPVVINYDDDEEDSVLEHEWEEVEDSDLEDDDDWEDSDLEDDDDDSSWVDEDDDIDDVLLSVCDGVCQDRHRSNRMEAEVR